MVYFRYYNNISDYYHDGIEGVTITNDYADIQRDPALDSPYTTILSPDLNNYSVSLLLDDQNRVNDFYVYYETEDYDKTIYTQFNTTAVFFYDKELLPLEIVIPDEVLYYAVDAGSRG